MEAIIKLIYFVYFIFFTIFVMVMLNRIEHNTREIAEKQYVIEVKHVLGTEVSYEKATE